MASDFARGRGRPYAAGGQDRMLWPGDVAEAVRTVVTQPRSMRTLMWSMRSMAAEN